MISTQVSLRESHRAGVAGLFSDCKENERRWMELGGEDAAKTWLTLLLVAFCAEINQ